MSDPTPRVVPQLRADECDGSIVDRFGLIAKLCGDLTAARSPGREVTFGELDTWSDAVAARVAGAGGPPDEPVLVLLGHDVSAVAAVLGVAKAGRPCVPLDASAPPDRLDQIARLAGATICVTDDEHRPIAEGIATVAGVVDVSSGEGPAVVGAPHRTGTDPAAIVFTSGSTGEPKGVVWNHNTFLAHHWCFQESLGLGPGDRMPLFLACSFVAGINTISWALMSGCTLDMYDIRVSGTRALADWLRSTRPTGLVYTPSMLRTINEVLDPDEVLPGVRWVLTLGEAVYHRDISATRTHIPSDAPFITSYGSSEAGPTTICSIAPDAVLPGGVVPAGWPLPGKRLRVEREDGSLAAIGETGEVVVLDDRMSGGYWRAPEQTATRFGVAPDGTRSYRSGDLGRLDSGGCLRMLGRNDAAVKVRGYLVEPIEIEAALLASDEIGDAVVVADRSSEQVRLVAYVVPAAAARPSPAAIRRLLRTKLPSYMVPATIVTLPVLPRTPRGKVDRLALPAAPPAPRLGLDPPRDQWEWAMTDIWAQALNLETVGVHDDFVELGGDSLTAEELVTSAGDALGLDLPTSMIADAPTVAEFTARVAGAHTGDLRHPTVVPLRTGGTGTPLFCFAGAGGLAITFLGLARHFAGVRPVYGIQAHGLERRAVPDWTIRAAARRHLQHVRLLQPRGPYVFVGHSFGGLVAQEAARILRDAGEQVALLVLIDTFAPDHVPDPHADPPPSDTRTAVRVAYDRTRQLVQLPLAGVVRFRGMTKYDVFFNQGRAITMLHRPRPWDGRAILYLAGRNGPDGWTRILVGDVAVRVMDASHDTIVREPHVTTIAGELREDLAELGL